MGRGRERPGAAARGWDMALDSPVPCQRTVCLSPTTRDRARPAQVWAASVAAAMRTTISVLDGRGGEANGAEVTLGWVLAADKIAHLERAPHLPDRTQNRCRLISSRVLKGNWQPTHIQSEQNPRSEFCAVAGAGGAGVLTGYGRLGRWVTDILGSQQSSAAHEECHVYARPGNRGS